MIFHSFHSTNTRNISCNINYFYHSHIYFIGVLWDEITLTTNYKSVVINFGKLGWFGIGQLSNKVLNCKIIWESYFDMNVCEIINKGQGILWLIHSKTFVQHWHKNNLWSNISQINLCKINTPLIWKS